MYCYEVWGVVFEKYQDISNSVVDVLMRAGNRMLNSKGRCFINIRARE